MKCGGVSFGDKYLKIGSTFTFKGPEGFSGLKKALFMIWQMV